eukprot:ANDGO_04544.mRNA.1 hypothetical protein GUITHDRAFT_73694
MSFGTDRIATEWDSVQGAEYGRIRIGPSLNYGRSNFGAAVDDVGNVFVVGGKAKGRTISSIECLQVGKSHPQWWKVVVPSDPSSTLPRYDHSVTMFRNQIVCCGGIVSLPDSAPSLTPIVEAWSFLQDFQPGNMSSGNMLRPIRFSSPISPRAGHSTVVLKRMDHLLVLGGRTHLELDSADSSVECLILPSSRSRQECPSMLEPREHFAAVAIDSLDSIYAIGGASGSGSSPLASVERWDVRTRRWAKCCPLNQPNMRHSAVVVQDLIYCVGGTARDSWFEIYEPRVDAWRTVDVPFLDDKNFESRKDFGCVAYENRIYGIGGSQNRPDVDVVDVVPPAVCSVRLDCRAFPVTSSKSRRLHEHPIGPDFDLTIQKARFFVGNREVQLAVEPGIRQHSNANFWKTLNFARPIGFPVVHADMPLTIEKLDIDRKTVCRPSRFRVLVVGESEAGKSSLIRNLSSGGSDFLLTISRTEVGDIIVVDVSLKSESPFWNPIHSREPLISKIVRRQFADQKVLQESLDASRAENDQQTGSNDCSDGDGGMSANGVASRAALAIPRNHSYAHHETFSLMTGDDPVALVEDMQKRRAPKPSPIFSSTAEQDPDSQKSSFREYAAGPSMVTHSEPVSIVESALAELLNETVSLSVFDFAGQNVFRAFDPLFFGKQCMYLCVFNLQSLHDAWKQRTLSAAVDRQILSWLKQIEAVHAINVHTPTVAATSSKISDGRQECLSTVLLIGTHANSEVCDASSFLKELEDILLEHIARLQFNFIDVPRLATSVGSPTYSFLMVENNPAERCNHKLSDNTTFAKCLLGCIQDFQKKLPKIRLKNLLVESVVQHERGLMTVLSSDIFTRFPGLSMFCKDTTEARESFDELVSLGSFFALPGDKSVIVIRPDAFVRACAHFVAADFSNMSREVVNEVARLRSEASLWQNHGIMLACRAKNMLRLWWHLQLSASDTAWSSKSPAQQKQVEDDIDRVFNILESFGILVPVRSDSVPGDRFFFPQWSVESARPKPKQHREHCYPTSLFEDFWESSSVSTEFVEWTFCVRCVGIVQSKSATVELQDAVLTPNHFWRFISFLARHPQTPFWILKSKDSDPITGTRVTVFGEGDRCREECTIQLLWAFDTDVQRFEFQCTAPRNSAPCDFLRLFSEFLQQDPLSKQCCTRVGFMANAQTFVDCDSPSMRRDSVCVKRGRERFVKERNAFFFFLEDPNDTFDMPMAKRSRPVPPPQESQSESTTGALMKDVYTGSLRRFCSAARDYQDFVTAVLERLFRHDEKFRQINQDLKFVIRQKNAVGGDYCLAVLQHDHVRAVHVHRFVHACEFCMNDSDLALPHDAVSALRDALQSLSGLS